MEQHLTEAEESVAELIGQQGTMPSGKPACWVSLLSFSPGCVVSLMKGRLTVTCL